MRNNAVARHPERRTNRPSSLSTIALVLLLAAALLPGCRKDGSSPATYPVRSIELIVPWAAGGGTDRVARFLADALQRRVGQPVIVVNRTGGSGAVGHSVGALAAPDGYTLTMATFELSTMRAMGISKLRWDDFTPIAQLNGDAAAILVRKDAPWKTLGELLDSIRQRPGALKMSGTATGGAWDLARSGLLLAAGIPPTNIIWSPSQGSAPALVELLGGHIDVVSCSVPEAAAQIEGDQVRVLAVLSAERLAEYPALATAREQGIDYEAVGWRGIMAPKGMPPEVVRALNDHFAAIAGSPEFRQFMKKNGFAVVVRDATAFGPFLAAQESKWNAVIHHAGYASLGHNHDPGPQAMPWLLTALLVIAVAAEFIRSRRAAPAPEGDAGLSRDALFLLLALVVYLVVMPWIGFMAATALFAGTVMIRLGARWWLAAVSSLSLVGMIHLLFVVLFKVQLP